MSEDFKSMSAEIVRNFLQTVVVVDDETPLASQNTDPAKDKVQDVIDITGPVSEEKTEADQEDEATNLDTKNDEFHFLDAKQVIDSFAEQGLVCSILQPEKGEEGEIRQGNERLVDRVLRVSSRSDLLVLDWEIDDDDGDIATEIVKKVIERDRENRQGSLRLIAIYTGNAVLKNISKKIADALNLDHTEGEPIINCGPARVVIYAKEALSGRLGEFENRLVAFRDLPERLIADFADMTHGLVSNAAIKSLSVLRDNAHPLLSRLHSGLDASYLTHRLLLPEPSDASDFLVDLLVSELRAILDSNGVGEHSSGNEIDAWMKARHDETTSFDIDGYRERDDVIICLTTGSDIKLNKDKRRRKFGTLTAALGRHTETKDAEKLNMEFAVLTSMRDQYSHVEFTPRLTLGTIVEEITEGDEPNTYLLCLQPRCDSVRLQGQPRQYPFLPYAKLKPDETNFNLVVRENDEFVRLRLLNKPFHFRIETFKPTEGDLYAVHAIEEDGTFVFESHSSDSQDPTQFRWVAELKREQAQRALSNLATHMSRVGLDEFEWLRLSAKEG